MRTVHTVSDLRGAVRALRMEGRRLALVPTMGALHEGHLSLIRAGRELADAVCATIFVNPRQFGPHEDFDAYPRRMEEDRAMLARAGMELLLAPAVEGEVSPGFVTTLHVARLTEGLCGADRRITSTASPRWSPSSRSRPRRTSRSSARKIISSSW